MNFKDNPQTDFKAVDKLSEKEARKEAEALRDALAYHNQRYYNENDPAISDTTYDKLFHRLQDLEENFPDLSTPSSPTRRVGAPPTDRHDKVEHAAPMLSLNASLNREDVADFFRFVRERSTGEKPSWVAEPKFDGVSVEVIYRDGEFSSGATRGDGRTGEDISDNLATIRTLPLRLQGDEIPAYLAVRGEVFLPKKAFQKLNRSRVENNQDPYVNPRNACAGIIRRLESKIVAQHPLDIIFFDILKIDGQSIACHWSELEALEAWGLKTDPSNERISGFDSFAEFRARLAENRDHLDYEIDGAIAKVDDLSLRDSLGARQRSPRWAIAWKFEPREEVTRLEEIVVQVGTSGILTPVALLQPVEVGGVTVSRATLHNETEVAKKDLRKGDKVRVARAGDVIPEVVERVDRPNKFAHKFHMPKSCPSCGTAIVREGAYAACPAGLSCPAQLRGRIRHYGSREALDIDHLGERTAEQLVAKGLVTTLSDLYRLETKDLKTLEGFADKSSNRLINAIQGSCRPRLDRFLFALAIRHVGSRLARTLADRFGTLERLMDADQEELEAIPDIGPEIAASLVRFFSENREGISALKEAGVEVQPLATETSSRPLEGTTFVFTGALEKYTRSEAQRAVEDLGASATSSVSGNTDYLVTGKEPGQKLAEAKELGVKILGEDDFLGLLASGDSE